MGSSNLTGTSPSKNQIMTVLNNSRGTGIEKNTNPKLQKRTSTLCFDSTNKGYVKQSLLQRANSGMNILKMKTKNPAHRHNWKCAIKKYAYTKEELQSGNPEQLLGKFEIVPSIDI